MNILRTINRLTIQSKRVRTHTLNDGTKVVEPFSLMPLTILILYLISAWAWQVTRVDLIKLVVRFGNFFEILADMTEPRWEYFNTALKPMIDTIQMSFLGSLLGAIFALPIAVLSSANINKNKLTLGFSRFILSIIRTIPILVYALIFALVFGYGTLAGTLAIMIFTFALLSKMLYEQIETIDMGAYVAIESTGATKVQAFSAAVMPQIMPSYLSLSLYSFEINIRFAAILGYVGAGGVGMLLDNRMAWRRYHEVIVVLMMLFVVVFTIESISRFIRRRLT
jgi:phosphonate transport system permease protein